MERLFLELNIAFLYVLNAESKKHTGNANSRAKNKDLILRR